MERERIVAVGLLTEREVKLLGDKFRHLYPIDESDPFASLLRAIDEADIALQRRGDAAEGKTLRRF